MANPPVIDMRRYMEAWVGRDVFGMTRDIRPEDVAGVPEDLMPKQMQWGIESICRRFGVPSFSAWREAIAEYRLGDLVGEIHCPVLALVGDRERDEPLSQFEAFVEGVAGPVTARRFAGGGRGVDPLPVRQHPALRPGGVRLARRAVGGDPPTPEGYNVETAEMAASAAVSVASLAPLASPTIPGIRPGCFRR